MVVERRVTIPAGITAAFTNFTMAAKGSKGELTRDMRYPGVNIAITDGEVVITTESGRKRVIAMVGTYAAHVKNMFDGVAQGYEYRMKVISPGVKVAIGNDEVTITGINKDLVGATSAKIERATKVRKRDTRVFQDGIYIVEKA